MHTGKNILTALLAGLVWLCCPACEQGPDDEPPAIDPDSFSLLAFDADSGAYLNDALTTPAEVPGSLQLSVRLDDNQLLFRIITSLEPLDPAVPDGRPNIFRRVQRDTFPVSGNSVITAKEIELSESLGGGEYTFQFSVFDEAGNQRDFGPLTLQIRNELPLVRLQEPLADSVTLPLGQSLAIQGEVTANSPLRLVEIAALGADTSFTLATDSAGLAQPYVLDRVFAPADTALRGTYDLRVQATDSLDRQSSISFRMLIF